MPIFAAGTGGAFSGGAPCGVGWAACEFQSCAAAMRGVSHISDFEGRATRPDLSNACAVTCRPEKLDINLLMWSAGRLT